MASQQPLTRQELRDELQCWGVATLRQDWPDLVAHARAELRQELQSFLLSWPPLQAPTACQSGHCEEGGESIQDMETTLRRQPRFQADGTHCTRLSTQDAAKQAALRARAAVNGDLGEHPSEPAPVLNQVERQYSDKTWFNRHYVAFHRGTTNLPKLSSLITSSSPFGGRFRTSRHEYIREEVERFRTSATSQASRQSPGTGSLGQQPRRHRGRSWLARLVNNSYFDTGVGFLILLNAISIGVQTDYMARHTTDEVPLGYRGIEVAFCICFTVELLLRLCAHGCRFFCIADWQWNIFDCLLVALQLAEELVSAVAANMQQTADGMKTDFSVMRILRILRLIRIVRLVRILRLIGELRTIVVSIAGSIRSLCWTVLLLVMIMYLVGVYLTQLVSDHRVSHLEEAPGQLFADGLLDDNFGSLGNAMMSLYQSITGGVNWHLISDPMMEHISTWVGMLVSLYIAFSLFALMNIVTGVFVESALATAKSDKDMFLLHFVRKLFKEADKDSSGSITWEEFQSCLGSTEMQMYFEALDLDVDEAETLFRLLDIDSSGEVDFEEFVNGCFRLRGSAKALDLATFMKTFDSWMANWERFAQHLEFSARLIIDAMGLREKMPNLDNGFNTGTSAKANMFLMRAQSRCTAFSSNGFYESQGVGALGRQSCVARDTI